VEEQMAFSDREEFREWLRINHDIGKGVWLVFSKTSNLKTIKADEALEEALCFGWIDGQIKSLGEERYIKKFTPRVRGSRWSEVNRKKADGLIQSGKMTRHGFAAIENAKKTGSWETAPRESVSGGQIEILINDLKTSGLALANFMKMPLSVRKTYTAWYLDAKQKETKSRRLLKIIDRLKQNLRPM
jgi:uncharacterized protein YdeI (YjbR/CyaY-like superfamily)